jgi:hypothetical protein
MTVVEIKLINSIRTGSLNCLVQGVIQDKPGNYKGHGQKNTSSYGRSDSIEGIRVVDKSLLREYECHH